MCRHIYIYMCIRIIIVITNITYNISSRPRCDGEGAVEEGGERRQEEGLNQFVQQYNNKKKKKEE